MKRNESCSSLSSLVHYDFLQQKLKGLEEENHKMRLEVRTVKLNVKVAYTVTCEIREDQIMADGAI